MKADDETQSPESQPKVKRKQVQAESKNDGRTESFTEQNNFGVKLHTDHDVVRNLVGWFTDPYALCAYSFLVFGYAYQSSLSLNFPIIGPLMVAVWALLITAMVAYVNTLRTCYALHSDDIDNPSRWLFYDDLVMLRNEIHWSTLEPEVESITWFNEIAKKLWSLFDEYIKSLVEDIIDDDKLLVNNSILGPSIRQTGLRLGNVSLGKTAPEVTGLKVLRRGLRRNQLIIDMEVTCNCDIQFSVKGNYHIQGGLEQVYCRLIVRVIVGPLFRETPIIGGVLITLIKRPIINWKFTGLLRCLNADILKLLTSRVISNLFQSPRRVYISLAKHISRKQFKFVEPIGFIKIDLIDASNLPSTDSCLTSSRLTSVKPKAFCTISYEDETKRTQSIANSENPDWNRTFVLLFRGKETNCINFLISDENSTNLDKVIAVFRVPLSMFSGRNSNLNGLAMSAFLRDPKTGRALKSGKTKISFRITFLPLTCKVDSLLKINRRVRGQSHVPCAVITVYVDYVTGLETVYRQYRTPELRTLVRISVGNQMQATSIKERTGCPIWEEALSFLLFDPTLEDLHIEVIDMYNVMEQRFLYFLASSRKNDVLTDWTTMSESGLRVGYLVIPVVNIVNASGMILDGTFALEGYVVDASIRVVIAIRSMQHSSEVLANYGKAKKAFPEEENFLVDQKVQPIVAGRSMVAKESQINSKKVTKKRSVVNNPRVRSKRSKRIKHIKLSVQKV